MAPMTRRRFLRGALGGAGALAAAALLGACGGSDPARSAGAPATATSVPSGARTTPPAAPAASPAAEPPVDLVRVAWWTDVGRPTPFQISVSGPGGAALLTLIYDTLTWKDEYGIIPWLGASWEASSDGKTYTFRLVDGATWHDGTPLTADDVAFTFAYYARHPYVWMPTTVVTSATALPDGRVQIGLARPDAAFLEDIAGNAPIVPRHVWEPVADPIKYTGANATIGSGPYTLAAYDATQGAYRLLANDHYWRGRPRVREWRQVTVPSQSSVPAAQHGDVDIALSADASVQTVLASDARLRVFATAPLSIVRLVVNTERAPVDRVEVRQAIMYALDRARIAETITHGPAIVGSAGVIPPETPWFDPNLKTYPYDPATARQLLGGKSLSVELLADPTAREPDLMAPMLAAVGITLNVRQVDAATRTQLLEEGNFQLALTSHIGVGCDPDYLRRWYAGEETNSFAQGSIFHDSAYTALGSREAAELDPATRRQLVFQMQAILAEQLPTIVLYYRRFYWVYDPARLRPMNTWGGLLDGIPFPNNKLIVLGN
ncbi:MAG TPA: ABC transporter substrate-binding protein [Thermomicrobiaceae bacterium]|nr:ABC transporter substrate-binding protein [Thermomicrobiaceae bacterium]